MTSSSHCGSESAPPSSPASREGVSSQKERRRVRVTEMDRRVVESVGPAGVKSVLFMLIEILNDICYKG